VTATRGLPNVLETIERMAMSQPHADAIRSPEGILTYSELSELINQAAQRLHGLGKHSRTVAIVLPRTRSAVVALLAAWRAGYAYAPLDPRWPRERLNRMLDQLQPAAVWIRGADAQRIDTRWPLICDDPEAPVRPRSEETTTIIGDGTEAAYVLCTSGTTGTPRAAIVTHEMVDNDVRSLLSVVLDHERPTIVASTPLTFDVSVFEIVAALMTGGCIDFVDSVLALRDRDEATGSVLCSVPSLLRQLLEDPQVSLRYRSIVTAGEPLTADLVGLVHDRCPQTRLFNAYGQVETFYTSIWEVPRGESEPPPTMLVGHPLQGKHAYVLDSSLAEVSHGEVGELFVSGLVSPGYVNSPRHSALRFVPLNVAQPGIRAVRTGDLVRRTSSGLEYVGRVDRQIKIAGVGVNVSDIESLLTANPNFREAAVILNPKMPADLVVFVVPQSRQSSADPEADARQALESALPSNLGPAVIVVVDHIPRASSGKIDYHAVADLYSSGPAGPVLNEQALVGLFKEVLDVDSVSPDADFFGLGGYSLKVAGLASRIRATFDVPCTMLDIIANPTPRGLARLLTPRRQT